MSTSFHEFRLDSAKRTYVKTENSVAAQASTGRDIPVLQYKLWILAWLLGRSSKSQGLPFYSGNFQFYAFWGPEPCRRQSHSRWQTLATWRYVYKPGSIIMSVTLGVRGRNDSPWQAEHCEIVLFQYHLHVTGTQHRQMSARSEQ
jgi:hypothetical protein